MDDNTRSDLKQAYKLIKANRKNEALALLKEVVQREPENVDAWWLAAFAAPSPERAIQACKRVMSLKPDHPVVAQYLMEQESLKAAAPMASQSFPAFEKMVPRPPNRRLLTFRNFIFLAALISVIAATAYGVPLLFGINWGLVASRLPFVGQLVATVRPTAAAKVSNLFPSLPPGIEIGTQRDNVDVTSTALPIPGSVEIGQADDYRFYGTKNARLSVSIKFVLPLDSRKTLLLLGPDGKPVASSYQSVGAGAAKLDYVLPQDGYYVVRIIGVEGVAQGAYMVQFQISI